MDAREVAVRRGDLVEDVELLARVLRVAPVDFDGAGDRELENDADNDTPLDSEKDGDPVSVTENDIVSEYEPDALIDALNDAVDETELDEEPDMDGESESLGDGVPEPETFPDFEARTEGESVLLAEVETVHDRVVAGEDETERVTEVRAVTVPLVEPHTEGDDEGAVDSEAVCDTVSEPVERTDCECVADVRGDTERMVDVDGDSVVRELTDGERDVVTEAVTDRLCDPLPLMETVAEGVLTSGTSTTHACTPSPAYDALSTLFHCGPPPMSVHSMAGLTRPRAKASVDGSASATRSERPGSEPVSVTVRYAPTSGLLQSPPSPYATTETTRYRVIELTSPKVRTGPYSSSPTSLRTDVESPPSS